MSYERLDSCPVCNNSQLENFMIVKDHFLTGESFVLNQCPTCSLLFTNPRPTADSISAYYNSPDYISHSGQSRGPVTFIYKLARYFNLRKKEKLINRFSSSRKLVDVGCGTGEFLAFCQKKGWEVLGVEPNRQAAKIAEQKIAQSVIRELSEYNGSGVEIITFWHVLEHVHSLNDTIKVARKMLNDDGVIVVALPNHKSWDAQKYGESWAGWDVPRHLYHFNRKSVETLARKHKFIIEKVLPMKLDSYYVSLLSEQYSGNRFQYLNGYLSGYRSNQSAKHTNDYSSLIYIMRKK